MKTVVVALLCVAFGHGRGRAADDSPQDRLDAAKAKYLKDMNSYREEVNAYFEKREEAARKDGNKKQVDAIKTEKKLFEDTGALPKSESKSDSTLSLKAVTIRKELEKAYGMAVKEFTKVKQDDEAAQAQEELKAFVNLVGTWREIVPNPGLVRVFKFGGELTEFGADGKLLTTGEWAVDKNGKVTVNLKNGFTLTCPIPTIGNMKVEVFPPGKTTPSATLTFRRVVK